MNEYEYMQLLYSVMRDGEAVEDRTGVGTRSLVGQTLRLGPQLAVLTGKKIHFKSVIAELLWFLRGDTNIGFLHEHGVSIWDEWADENGDLGPVYGHQWRKGAYDQLARVVDALGPNGDPFSRRLVVDAWQVADLDAMRLPPCHMVWQVFVRPSEKGRVVHMVTYQRSADLFLGVPFNMASYSVLQRLLCAWAEEAHAHNGERIRHTPGNLTMNFGDVHIYNNHTEQVEEYLDRAVFVPPTLWFLKFPFSEISLMTPSEFELQNYVHGPSIPAPVAV
jgi:thymidylate synthase